LDDELLVRMEELAELKHLTRSGVFAEAAREYILRHENQILMEAINDTHGKKEEKEDAQLKYHRRRKHRRMVEGQW